MDVSGDSARWGVFFRDCEEQSALKCFGQLPVDLKGLGEVDIQYDHLHGICVRWVLKHHPRIAPIRNDRLSAQGSNEFLFVAELKTGQFVDAPFDRIHGGV